MFYTEIQDGHQKRWQNDLQERAGDCISPVDPKFHRITLSRTASEINVTLCFPQSSRWLPKMFGKTIFAKKWNKMGSVFYTEI